MGLILEDPKLEIEWRIRLNTFLDLFPTERLHQVTPTYYTAACTSHNGLRCMIGFHFGDFPLQANEPLLYDIEFFRKSYPDLKVSFEDFQNHFEKVYGAAEITGHAEDFPSHRWIIPEAEIKHSVQDRFGLEEHLHIFC